MGLQTMRILGIETSCDETSVAVLETGRRLNLKGFAVSSQVKIHARWGGVVPELAARRHAETIIPLLDQTLLQAKTKPEQLDLIAVTQGPGLITALQVGVETAKALAFGWGKPLVGVNHIAGHLVSPFLSPANWPLTYKNATWPAVALVVSGGHTEIYELRSFNRWKLMGKTLDDAAGEAFDKVAKMLKLPYPGGPRVAKLAEQGSATAFKFPRPLLARAGYDFSFAGLKTAVLYAYEKAALGKYAGHLKADICASFQQAAIDALVGKTIRAAHNIKARTIIVAGGVSANTMLRRTLQERITRELPATRLLLPELRFCGDNAAMIALAGLVAAAPVPKTKLKMNWKKINANANWELW